MHNTFFIMVLLAYVAALAAARSRTEAPTIEQLEAQIEQAQQAAAKKATLVIKTDTRCQLSINGEDRGQLEAQATQRLLVDPGEQLIECVGNDHRVDQTETVVAGHQYVVQLVLPPLAAPERFERVTGGVKDNEQNLIWAVRDNGIDTNWNNATQYCASLGSGWALPSSMALESMYDASGKYPVRYVYSDTTYTINPATPLIKFTGKSYWTNERDNSSAAWQVNLKDGDRLLFPVFIPPLGNRALCVRS